MVAEEQVATLAEGATILSDVLRPAGFEFEPGPHGKGSGGPSAQGHFVRDSQSIEVHFRWSLGLVSYAWDGTSLSHADFLRGLGLTGSYPGFGKDPLDGFRHLAADLAGPLASFVAGDRKPFGRAAEFIAQHPKPPLP
jgi:hypothetical protein